MQKYSEIYRNTQFQCYDIDSNYKAKKLNRIRRNGQSSSQTVVREILLAQQ